MTNLFHISLVLCLSLVSSFSYANSTTPADVIDTLHQSLIQSMKDADTKSYDQRYKTLKPVVMNSFDFETISRVVLGRHWKKLDEGQKSKFVDTFSRLSVATYTSQFTGYSGQSFEYLQDKTLKKSRVLVKTQLKTSERVIAFNYILHPANDGWRIINVVADGVSDLSLKKSDYAAIMKAEGFEILVRKLLDKLNSSGKKPS